jgi:tetratricopeptide (TPR) repeat protein
MKARKVGSSGGLWLGLLLWVFAGGAVFAADETAVEHFAHASQLAQQGNLDDAAREYRSGLAIDASSAPAFNNLGSIYFQQHDFQRAADAFGRAHKLQPSDPAISFNLGLALFNTRNFRAAVPPLTDGILDTRHSVDAHFLLGACYQYLKQYPRSIVELELAHKARPRDDKTLFLLFTSYRLADDPNRALEAAAELLKTNPESPFLYEVLGTAYDAESKPTEAEQEFKQAIAASPHAPQLHFILGYIDWRWKRYADAVAPLQEETRISPNFAPPYHYLGDIALKQGHYDQAVAYFKEALRLDPTYGEADLGLGRAYVQLGRYEQSVKFLRQAVERLPDQVESHYWLGKALLRVGKSDEGQRELAKADQINQAKDRQASENMDRVMNPSSVKGSSAPN